MFLLYKKKKTKPTPPQITPPSNQTVAPVQYSSYL